MSNGESWEKIPGICRGNPAGSNPELNAFLEEWGMGIESGVLFEMSTDHLFSNTSPFQSIVDYENEDYSAAITNKNIPVAIFQSRAVEILQERDSIKVLLQSSENSGIYPADAAEDWQPEGKQFSRPDSRGGGFPPSRFPVWMSTSNVAVIGSAAAFASSFLSSTSLNNSAYFINMFNTLAEREDTVMIEAKTLGGATMNIMTNVSIPLGVVFTIVLPLLILVTGLVIWIRRRNR